MLAPFLTLLVAASSLAVPALAEPRVRATRPEIRTVAGGAPAPTFVALQRNLAPPVDARGRPWHVEVVPETGTAEEAEPVAAATARADGTWRHAKVPAGLSVRLRVRTEDGDVWWTSPEPFSTSDAEPSDRIELGTTRVRGVARVGKQPVERFELAISEEGTTPRLEEGEGGAFRYDRISPGTTYYVYVMVPWKSSPTYRVRVPEDDDPEYIKAVVGKRRGFRGHVVSTAGVPVPGGRGYLATVPSGGLDQSWFFPKGARAAFTARVTEPSRFACVFLAPPGHAAHLSMREATPDDHEIVVTPAGGTLVLEAPVEPLRVPALFRNGCALRLAALASTSRAFVYDRGRTLEVVSPPVEPGPWTLCLVTRGELESYVGGDPEFPYCVGGLLAPGSRLELSLVGVEPVTSP